MYPKNFIDYKLYLRRLSLPQFVTEWFGNKNACFNKISREALKNNLDINELLLNIIFQIIHMLHIDQESSDQIIGSIIHKMIEVQQSFESFKYYKYGLEDYNNRKNRLESQYQQLLQQYQQEMQQVVIEREEYSKIKIELEKVKEENFTLVQENIQLKEENKNIHDSFDKNNKITSERIELQEEEIGKLRNSLSLLSEEKNKVQLVLLDTQQSKQDDLENLINKFQNDFDTLRFEKEDLYRQNIELINQIQDLSRIKTNNNDGLSQQHDYYINKENLQATKSILGLALEEIQRISRDGQLTGQLKRHIVKEKYCVEYFCLNKYLTKDQKRYISQQSQSSNSSSNQYNNNDYSDSYSSNIASSSNSTYNRNRNNNNNNKRSNNNNNNGKKNNSGNKNLTPKEWNALYADRR